MKRKLLVALLLLIAAAAAWFLLQRYLGIEAIVARESALRRAIAERPIAATLVGFLVYTAVSFVPGTGGKSLVVGWLFGFWSALVQVNLGLTIVAMATFWTFRYLFRDAVRERASARIIAFDRALTQDGAYYLFALRVLHSPFSLTNYVMSATSIRSREFWWATQLGMLPGNIVFVYTGAQVPSLEELAREGLASVFTPRVLAALLLLGLFPLVVRTFHRRFFGGGRREVPGE